EPLGMEIILRSCRQVEGGLLRGGQAVRLYRKAVSPRRKIAEEIAADRDFTERCAVREHGRRRRVDVALAAWGVPCAQEPHPRRAGRERRDLRLRRRHP